MLKGKTSSRVLDKAATRVQGMKAIDPTLDLGNGLSLAAVEATVNQTRTRQDAYNQLVSILEEKQTEFEESEKALNDLLTRILAGVLAKYGKDSLEYTQVGGTRSSDRKRPARKTKSTPKAISQI